MGPQREANKTKIEKMAGNTNAPKGNSGQSYYVGGPSQDKTPMRREAQEDAQIIVPAE